MALTRPSFNNINTTTTQAYFSDPQISLNYGNVSANNQDIGFVFNRGSSGNVSLVWSETTRGFLLAYTSSSGLTSGNIVVTRNANLSVGNLTGSGTIVGATVNAATIGNTGATLVGTTANIAGNASIVGNLTTGNVLANGYFYSNGAAISQSITLNGDATGSGQTGSTITVTLANSGVTAGTYGSATAIPTVVIDSKGRVTNITTNSVSTSYSLAAGSGTGTVSGGGTLTVNGTANQIETSVSGSTYTIKLPESGIQNIPIGNSTASSGAFTTLSATGTFTGSTVNATTIGNAGALLTGSTVNAATIGNTGALLTGTLQTASQTNITAIGNITTGTWSATTIELEHGGTGATTAATARTNLGLVIGTDVQAYNSTLAAVAGGTYTGDDHITTVGTIGTGTWNATTIATNKGGTGLTSFTANGAIYATSTSALTTGTLPVASGGTGVTTSTGSGSVVLSTSPSLTTPVLGAATGTSLNLSGALTASGTATVNALASNGAVSGTTGTFSGAVSGGSTGNFSGAVTVASLAANADVIVGGNLTVNGTTTTINVDTVTVEDKNIVIGNVATPTDVTADGGGITLKGATDKTFNWISATTAWTSSEDINVVTGKGYEVNGTSVLNATTLGSSVVNSSLTSVGTLTNLTVTNTITGNVSGNAGTATKLATARTIALTGDVTGSGTFDGSGNLNIAATIAADSVALGTDTTGNYVSSLTNGSYITGANGGSEGAALTLAVDATTTNTASKVVARDANGSFAANVITASLAGNATSADKLSTARTIALTGDVTGSATFDGSANASITATIADNSVALGTDTTGNYVATIAGTTNQITVTGSGAENAAVTLALPQNIHTGATPTFAGATLTGTLTGTVVNAATIGNVGTTLQGNGAALSGINSFSSISVSGQNTVVADSISDTLTLAAGTGIAITTDSTTDTVTIAQVSTESPFATETDLGLVTDAVTFTEDEGSVAEAVTVYYDLGSIVASGLIYPDQLVLPQYTVATLPSPTVVGSFIFVTNESGGSVPAFADGTNWRRVTDRAIVS